MGLWDKIKGEFIDIVQFLDESNDTLVHRFERYGHEIKNNAKLVVREGQAAVFVNEGRMADVMPPGTYTLDTKNMPVLSTLLGWKYGFESPFKAEVYFVRTTRFTDQKWGTKNPVMMEDPQYGPVFLRAFGTYAFRVKDPGKFIRAVVGTEGKFTVDEINEQLRNLIVTRFSHSLGEAQLPIMKLLSNYDELATAIADRTRGEFDEYGIEVVNLLVENISLPEDQQETLKKRMAMQTLGNVQADMRAYTQFQTAQSIQDAAKNPGGVAALGVGFGMGAQMAGQMGQAMAAQPAAPQYAASQAPPPLPGAAPAVAWFAGVAGTQAGPFDGAALHAQAAAGRITRDTLVWRAGMGNWVPAGQVPELAALFAQVPPPLPPR
jgi:membrane protease subunit (stomatin/prohibitin family)